MGDQEDEEAEARERLAHGLRALRCAAGKSLKQLEPEVHASDSALSRYFTGQAVPPWEVVESLCRVTGSPATELRTVWERASGVAHDRVKPAPAPVGAGRSSPPARRPAGRRRVLLVAGVLATAVLLVGIGAWLARETPEKDAAVPDLGPPEAIMLVNARVGVADGARYVVDIANWSQDEGAEAHLWHWRSDTRNDIRNQLWHAEPAAPGGTRFRNVLSNRCLAASPAGALAQSDCSASPAQAWQHTAQARLENLADRRCLDVKDHQLNDGEALVMAPCHDSPTQHWNLRRRTG
ncbi:ricin-type beta-trefoil lectin domain protein [Amycolatopsis samaneae]|uniref:Ricin-type beta-trefoil lectin domain protein n=1 Tax=Amycolatopsis samaneae TaxID=664691 RepID=A0ABW5GTG1_9PSEU